jgi:hypothetical protein
MPKQILSPSLELRALLAAASISLPELAFKAGIPKTRIADAISGCGELTIDDAAKCKSVLSNILVRRAQSQPQPELARATVPTNSEKAAYI